MAASTHPLPLSEVRTPPSAGEVASLVREAYAAATPMYPIGGGTHQRQGLTPKLPGWGIELSALTRVIDYPARDMTISVEAGMSLAALDAVLAAEGQQLPIDVPRAATATLGGAMATNTSGPRRLGQGTLRDYVIGLAAVDGRGVEFHSGGRVVKNVAGYDLAKLLIGSLGTLGIITQVTLKLKPRPPAQALLVCAPADLAAAERVLAAMITSETTPVAMELLRGPEWQPWDEFSPASAGGLRVAVALEGSDIEVRWMGAQLLDEWRTLGLEGAEVPAAKRAAAWQQLVEFAAEPTEAGDEAPLVLRLNVLAGEVTTLVARLVEIDPAVSIAAHAGNGIILARLSGLAAGAVPNLLVRQLQPAARAAGGNVVLLNPPSTADFTRQVVWGAPRADAGWMRAVKQQFDPRGLLNPGRFVY